MKKILALLVVVIVLTLSGCENGEGELCVEPNSFLEEQCVTQEDLKKYYTQEEVDELLGEYEYYQLKFEELEQRISELESEE